LPPGAHVMKREQTTTFQRSRATVWSQPVAHLIYRVRIESETEVVEVTVPIMGGRDPDKMQAAIAGSSILEHQLVTKYGAERSTARSWAITHASRSTKPPAGRASPRMRQRVGELGFMLTKAPDRPEAGCDRPRRLTLGTGG